MTETPAQRYREAVDGVERAARFVYSTSPNALTAAQMELDEAVRELMRAVWDAGFESQRPASRHRPKDVKRIFDGAQNA